MSFTQPGLAQQRLTRSELVVPGATPALFEKAARSPADAVFLDLEDAVAPDAKEAARANVAAAARSKAYGKREIAIRCNGLGTPWGEADIEAIARSGADAILVPKVESATQVTHVVSLLDTAGAPTGMAVWAMMETPKGFLRAEEIAGAHPRLGLFVMGTNDLVKDMRARHTPMRLPKAGPTASARSQSAATASPRPGARPTPPRLRRRGPMPFWFPKSKVWPTSLPSWRCSMPQGRRPRWRCGR